MSVISVSIPENLFKMLDKMAKKEERAKSYYIKKALENYFLQKLEDEEDYRDVIESLAQFKSSKEKGKNWKDLQKELGL
jgi:predicted DNA-binding protein